MSTEIFAPAADPTAPAPSVLDALRAKRAEIAQSRPRTLDLDVPFYDGKLVVRYHYPDEGADRLIAAARRSQDTKDRDAQVNAAADTLVATCDEVFGRDETGALVPLALDGPPVRFNRALAGLFEIAVPESVRSPARFIVRNVFSPRAAVTGVYDGDPALLAQAGRVTLWLQGEDVETAEEFSGEA